LYLPNFQMTVSPEWRGSATQTAMLIT
jgi:hypothetical protein